ncbi:guanylate kinase [bacterium]|nr:guanylate kinase [bacterium]
MTIIGQKGMLFVISGPSGVGKGTVIDEIIKRGSTFSLSISYTSRTPRKDEINGREYNFIDRESFQQLISDGAFLEFAEVHGNYYGTKKADVDNLINSGKNVIFEVDIQGGLNLKTRNAAIISIFLLPPNEQEIIDRLNHRGSETDKSLETRLQTMQTELPIAQKYDYQIINDDLEETVTKVYDVLRKYIEQ